MPGAGVSMCVCVDGGGGGNAVKTAIPDMKGLNVALIPPQFYK